MTNNDRREIDDTPLDLVILTFERREVCPITASIVETDTARRTDHIHEVPLRQARRGVRS